MKIILASASPRRKELLELLTKDFEVIPSNVEEKINSQLTLEEQAKQLSYIKAKDIYEKTSGDRIIIGSDTMVTKDNKIYGKPQNKEHAKQMIRELISGDKTHIIYTGLTVIIEKNGEYKEYKTFDTVKVYLKDITDEEIEKWINSGNAMDKAGAYGIQNEFCVFVEKIEGNYHSVVGLPTQILYNIIKKYIF
jgi:septum formation protein